MSDSTSPEEPACRCDRRDHEHLPECPAYCEEEETVEDRILSYCRQYPIVSADAPASMLRVEVTEVARALDRSREWIGYNSGPKGDPEERRAWLRVGHPDTPLRLAWEGFIGCVHDHWRESDDRQEVLAWLGRGLALDVEEAPGLLDVVGYPAPTRAQKEESIAALNSMLRTAVATEDEEGEA